MKLKRLIIISLLVMVLFIGAVSAANETDTLSNDDTGDEISVSDERNHSKILVTLKEQHSLSLKEIFPPQVTGM